MAGILNSGYEQGKKHNLGYLYLSQVVFTGTLDTESLKKAADVLESCLDLALSLWQQVIEGCHVEEK